MTLALKPFPNLAPLHKSGAPSIQPTPLSGLTIYRGISRSLHFIRRAEERGLREEVLEFILTYGSEWHRMGAMHLTVIERDLPTDVRGCAMAGKAKDWIVVLRDSDLPITCYRRANAARFLKKKGKTRWSDVQVAIRRAKKRGY